MGLRRPRGDDTGDDVPGAALAPLRHRRSAGALPAAAGLDGRLPGGDRPGSDVAAITASARREGDGLVLAGEKVYVTNGGIAEVTVVFAKLDGEVTAFILERGEAGAGRKEAKLGLRASYTGSMILDGVRIPADRLLGRPGQGFLVAMDFFESSRPQVAAGALGIARAAFRARDRICA